MTHSTAKKAAEARALADLSKDPRVITLDNITVNPDTAALFNEPSGLAPVPGLVTMHDKEGTLTAAYTQDGNLVGGALHRELLHLTAHKLHTRHVSAQRDTAVENANFWRRLALIATSGCVIGTGINIANALGWI